MDYHERKDAVIWSRDPKTIAWLRSQGFSGPLIDRYFIGYKPIITDRPLPLELCARVGLVGVVDTDRTCIKGYAVGGGDDDVHQAESLLAAMMHT